MDRRVRSLWTAVVVVACGAAVLTGCTAAPESPGATPSPLPEGDEAVTLDAADFTADIDNPYWPMTPGTRWTYREIDPDGQELRVTVVATSETREMADGITARVVRDTVFRGEEILEDTFDWYAQDADGAVWYLGEDTAEFEDGRITSREGSFEAGVDGALPGILIPADPTQGMTYRQEYYAGQAEDNGEVLSVHAMADAPTGHYTDVLLTWDTDGLEPDVAELKFYAPGVGPVLALEAAGGPGAREELIGIDQVSEGTGTQPLGDPG
ncbi:hypothetical protein [Microbacterium sp. NPDC058389]|uniref:hypothetical protein n=1 Tax=Microbacterium sp. NPDC058389 TaxID=3346475 RepID=UPI003654FDCF